MYYYEVKMASGTENKTIKLNKSLEIDGPILTAFVHTPRISREIINLPMCI